MKKIIWTAFFAAAIAIPASAATMFAVNTQFRSQIATGDGISTNPAVSGATLTGAETSVAFSSGGTFEVANCNITALCGTAGPPPDTVTATTGAVFDSSSVFTWNGGNMSYAVSTWVLQGPSGGQFSILTTGVYSSSDAVTYAPTPGVLNFQFGTPLTSSGYYFFTATGESYVPEPATMSLVGLGLIGLGVFARRRRKA